MAEVYLNVSAGCQVRAIALQDSAFNEYRVHPVFGKLNVCDMSSLCPGPLLFGREAVTADAP